MSYGGFHLPLVRKKKLFHISQVTKAHIAAVVGPIPCTCIQDASFHGLFPSRRQKSKQVIVTYGHMPVGSLCLGRDIQSIRYRPLIPFVASRQHGELI